MSMRGAPKLSPGVDAERARFSGTPSAVVAPAGSSRISGSCGGCFVSGLDCESARSQGGTHERVVRKANSVIRERKIPTSGLTSSDTSWSKEAMGAGPRRPPRAAMRRRGRHQSPRRLSLQQLPRSYCRHPAICDTSLISSNARSPAFSYHTTAISSYHWPLIVCVENKNYWNIEIRKCPRPIAQSVCKF